MLLHSTRCRSAAAAIAVAIAVVHAHAAGAQFPTAELRQDTLILRKFNFARVRMDSLITVIRSLEEAEFGSDQWLDLSRRLDMMIGPSATRQLTLRSASSLGVPMPKGWIGINTTGPSSMAYDTAGARVTYFGYPLIVSVDPESPAGRAGITPGDVLVAYDGVDLVGHEFNLTRLLVPERKLAVTVRRDGEAKDYPLVVAKAPSQRMFVRASELGEPLPVVAPRAPFDGDRPRTTRVGGGIITISPSAGSVIRGPMLPGGYFIMTRDGLLGASMVEVAPDLAKAIGINTGLLVKQVPENSAAAQSGLRVGDVIVNAGGRAVTTLDELHALLPEYMRRRELPLKVIRDHKTRGLTLKW